MPKLQAHNTGVLGGYMDLEIQYDEFESLSGWRRNQYNEHGGWKSCAKEDK